MGKIEKETSDSIIKNGHLLANLSRERIWDEVKKSYSQSKDFNEYLKYLSDFNLMQYIFPGSDINTNLVDSKDFVVVIANLFKNENHIGLERRLIQEYKIESDIATKIVFLVRILELTPELAFDMYKSKTQCHIEDSTILEWFRTQGINDPVKIKFLEYKPTTSAEELMSRGIKGRELGIEIKRLELENFKKLI
jgi:tRNA nucleotidyltransferase/poly(A) polymerase